MLGAVGIRTGTGEVVNGFLPVDYSAESIGYIGLGESPLHEQTIRLLVFGKEDDCA
jgi:hypothetical protein